MKKVAWSLTRDSLLENLLARSARPKVIGLCVVGLLSASCVRFHPKPVTPVRTLADFESRRLDDGTLREYLLAHQAAQEWPPNAWDLKSLTLAAFYYSPDLDVARAQSCDKPSRGWISRLRSMKEQIVYQGPLDAAGKGLVSVELLIKNQAPNSDMVFTSGTFQFSGRITAQTAGAILPKKLRFRAMSKSASGKPIATRYYDVNMQTDGTIPLQSFAYKNFDLGRLQ